MKIKLILSIISIFVISCSNKFDKLFETFYIGKNQYQYFIKPLTFESDNSDLFVDYTVRLLDTAKYATMNFTIESKENPGSCQKISYELSNQKIEINEIDEFYYEKKSDYIYRSSAKIDLEELIEIFDSEEIGISYFGNLEKQNFKANNSTLKKIKKINEDLMVFIKSKIN